MNITINRSIVEQALEALEMEATSPPIPETAAAITALHAALAQPDEKKIGCVQHDCDVCQARVLAQPEQLVVGGDDLPTLTKWTPMSEYAAKSAAVPGRAEALKQAGYTRRPRQLPKEDEPVAWMQTENFIDPDGLWDERKTFNCEGDGAPLYAHPPQRKPLTEADIKGIVDLGLQTWKLSESTVEFARAIERAHGIGGEE